MIYKVETIDQFKSLEFIKKNFNINFLDLETVDRNSIEITDINKAKMIIRYQDGNIITE